MFQQCVFQMKKCFICIAVPQKTDRTYPAKHRTDTLLISNRV
jgi:hypothetical protein